MHGRLGCLSVGSTARADAADHHPCSCYTGSRDHPDKQFRAYITEGIKESFRIGSDRNRSKIGAASQSCKMPSAQERPEVLDLHTLQSNAAWEEQ